MIYPSSGAEDVPPAVGRFGELDVKVVDSLVGLSLDDFV
jgi:hypothetical protein